MTVGRGEFLTLLGPSGSGKITFLMTLSGFEAPTRGRLTLNGADMTATPAKQRGFGIVFQGCALFPHMTAGENIAFPLRVQERSPAEIRRRVAEFVDMVGMGDHVQKRPAGLSGGQQQRVARALAYEPPVLLLDEPFSALDKNLRGQMQEEMQSLHHQSGTTFVFVTHDQSEAMVLISVALAQVDRRIDLATRSMGAGLVTRIVPVILPNIRSGVLTALFLTFVLSWEEIGITLFITSVQAMTLPRLIWMGLHDSIDPAIAAISAVLIGVVVAVILTRTVIGHRKKRS